jgi:hypothetical protein
MLVDKEKTESFPTTFTSGDLTVSSKNEIIRDLTHDQQMLPLGKKTSARSSTQYLFRWFE